MEKSKRCSYALCFFFFFLMIGTGINGFDGGSGSERRLEAGRRRLLRLRGEEETTRRTRRLFVFGDSYADTGNLGKLLGKNLARSWFEPYGDTFPRRPAGRFSDGVVLTDLVAYFLGNKSPVPYKFRKKIPALLPYGMNFAVGGSGVFDTGNFQRNLSSQIDTFQAQLDSGVFSDKDIASSAALVVISGNDYGHLKDTDPIYLLHLRAFMKRLFGQLKADLARLEWAGIPRVILTNMHPIQCTPSFTRRANYTYCPLAISFAVLEHNRRVHRLVKEMNAAGHADFHFLDVHSAFLKVLLRAKLGGGKIKQPLVPCCESSSNTSDCGTVDPFGKKLYSVCDRPEEHFYWDSVHPTQAGWAAVFEFLKPSLARYLGVV